MDRNKRLNNPARKSDLTVYQDMQMFILALEDAGAVKTTSDVIWVMLNCKNHRLLDTYFTWHYAGRPFLNDERFDEFANLDFSYIGDDGIDFEPAEI
jgi:hypothetical protein